MNIFEKVYLQPLNIYNFTYIFQINIYILISNITLSSVITTPALAIAFKKSYFLNYPELSKSKNLNIFNNIFSIPTREDAFYYNLFINSN